MGIFTNASHLRNSGFKLELTKQRLKETKPQSSPVRWPAGGAWHKMVHWPPGSSSPHAHGGCCLGSRHETPCPETHQQPEGCWKFKLPDPRRPIHNSLSTFSCRCSSAGLYMLPRMENTSIPSVSCLFTSQLALQCILQVLQWFLKYSKKTSMRERR